MAAPVTLYTGSGVEEGTSTTPVRVDPTGTTTQPVSGTVTANQGTAAAVANAWPTKIVDAGGVNVAAVSAAGAQKVEGGKTNNNAAPGATNLGALNAVATAAAPAYVEGNQVATSTDLAGNTRSLISSWFGSSAPTVGQKTSANSIPVVLPSDQTISSTTPVADKSAKASAVNALASAAIAAGGAGVFTYLHTIVIGFDSPAATEKLVQVKEGATVLLEFFVGKTSNPFEYNFQGTFKQPTANTAMTVELGAGGGGVTGKVNVTYHQA